MKNRLKDLFKKAWQGIAEYKITILVTTLWTVMQVITTVININTGFEPADNNTAYLYLSTITDVIILFSLSVFLSEICFGKNYAKYLFICVPSAVLVCICVYIFDFEKSILGIPEWRSYGITGGYVFVMLLMILYVSFIKSGLKFHRYLLITALYIMTAYAIWLILFLGSITVFTVSTILLFNISDEWIFVILILTVGLFLIPLSVSVFSMAGKNGDKIDINNFIAKFIIKYLLTCISMAIMCVGYIYILKIIITRQIPSNEIFPIVTSLFCIGAPIWLFDKNYEDDGIFSKLVHLLPYLMIPLMFLQVWSLCLRIHQYGITPERYLGILLIIFEICFVVIWKWFSEKISRLTIIAAVLAAVAYIMPYTNATNVSLICQKYFLDKYSSMIKSGQTLNELEYGRFSGSYKYMKNCGDEDENYYVNQYGYLLDDAKQDMAVKKHFCVNAYQMVDTLDITGFNTFTMLEQDEKYSKSGVNVEDVDFSHFVMRRRGTKEEFIIDLSDMLKYVKEDDGSDSEDISMKQNNKITIDSNTVFYLNRFSVSYTTTDDIITDYKIINVYGMLLEK